MELAPPCNKVHDAKLDNFICYGPYSSQELQNDTGSATSPPMSTINQHLNIKFLMYFKPLYSDTWCTFVMLKIRLKRKKNCTKLYLQFQTQRLSTIARLPGAVCRLRRNYSGGEKRAFIYTQFYQFLPILNSCKQFSK